MADIDILWPQGVDFGVIYPIELNGSPADLTGYTAACVVRAAEDRTSELYATLTASIQDTSNVVIQATAAVSLEWTWDFGYYDVKLIDPSSNPVKIVGQGTIIVDPIVTG